MTELVHAVIDDDPTAAAEFANEVFDKESGKLLKYQKLITHPKIAKCGCIPPPTNLDDSRRE